jgi:hypothetical protein
MHQNKSDLMTLQPIPSSLKVTKACRNIVEISIGLVNKSYWDSMFPIAKPNEAVTVLLQNLTETACLQLQNLMRQ